MKTSEFIEKALEIEGVVRCPETNNTICIQNSYKHNIAYVEKSKRFEMVTAIDSDLALNNGGKEELFMLLTEYAKTPLEAREEPKKYKLKHKLIRGNDGYLNYAGSKKELIFSSETEIRDIRATATIQEWESLTEQTWEDLLLQFKAIEV